MGRPEGGPRDYAPPVFMHSTPASGQLGVSPSRIEVYFDENVELEDAFNKVIISPVPKTTPVVRASGRRVTVELRDTLRPNTTYTVDFADAIKDLNEGNILDGFAIDFSTGQELDSLRISGMVFEARNLEPAQGMTVAVTTDLSDTALTKVPFERVARTNQLGQFTVRNLKPGTYRVYAINDVNRDNLWDRSEDVAFYDVEVTPGSSRVMATDTILKPDGTDSVYTREITAYTPDDILLTWFNEDYRQQYIKDYKRPARQGIDLVMGARSDTLPRVTMAAGKLAGEDISRWSLTAANPTLDSLSYWITDPDLILSDTINIAVAYTVPDSLGTPTIKSDTLTLAWREPKKKIDKDPVKQAHADSIAAAEAMLFNIAALSGSTHELRQPLRFSIPRPIKTIDTTMFHLEVMADTLWAPLALPPLRAAAGDSLCSRVIDYDWQPAGKYRLTADSAAVADIYGAVNRPFKHEFTLKKLEDYANLTFTISPVPKDSAQIYVELLDGSDNVKLKARATDQGMAKFELVTPGTYYARAFIDINGNGIWDTGSVAQHRQPEEVAYYNKKIDLRANWDNDLSWELYAIPLDRQKPNAIKKNKPKLKKGEKATNQDDQDVELDEWGEPINGSNRGSGNRFSLPGGLGGGRRQSSGTTGNLRDMRQR